MTIDLNTANPQPLKLVKSNKAAASPGAKAPSGSEAGSKSATNSAPAVSAKEVRAQQAEQQAKNAKVIQSKVAELNQLSQNVERSLLFEFDEDIGDTIITVKDKASGEVIRQIPSEEMVELSKRLKAVQDGFADAGVLLKSDV